jgi:type I protein arginine methyltransferase
VDINLSLPTGYSLRAYGDMIRDAGRMGPYVEALREAVQPGCTVIDIGAGTGIFSLLACEFGAERVHAIEPDPSIEAARVIAAANGFDGRIAFHRTVSTEVTLPEKADVVISDLRGILPLLEHHVASIVDARTRLLGPSGTLIPRRDVLHAALVEAPATYQTYAEPWRTNAYGLDLSAALPRVVNTWQKTTAKAESLLVAPEPWAELDYWTVSSPSVRGEASWRVQRSGTAHAVLIWFDAELADGIGFSNAPGPDPLIYGQAFFPLEHPVEVEEDDLGSVQLRADLVDGEYLWRWDTTITGPAEGSPPKAAFQQSTFEGLDLSPGTLRKRRDDFVPNLGLDGQIDAIALGQMNQGRPLRDVARELTDRFPARFATQQEALDRAAALSVKYSE